MTPALSTSATTQRWRDRQEHWAPPTAFFDPAEYGVELLDSDAEARGFVQRHHYSGSYVAARLRVGLYRKVGCLRSFLAGVCVFSVPMQPASIAHHAGVAEGVELGRLVLLDEVGFNGESWFVARALRLLRAQLPQLRAVLSYSDPLRRVAADGRVVTPGHVGQVYQALSAAYVGRGRGEHLYLDADGRTISRRALCKISGGERGWEPAAARLVAAGADPRRPGEEPRAWLGRVLPSFRRLKHPGNHAYVWRLDGHRLSSLPYPRRSP